MTSKKRKQKPAEQTATANARGGLRGLADRPWFWPAVVFALAFVLRAVYTSQVRFTPFFQTLGLDARFYDQWAREIAGGQSSGEAFFMSPLYSYYLAGLYRLFGRDLLLIRLIQAGMGAGSAVIAYLLGTEVFDRRVGILSGLVMACYGALIFYDCSVLLTPLLVLLNLSALYLLVRADSSGRNALYVASGALLGLAAVGRAAALVFAPVAVLWILFARRTEGAARRPDAGSRARRRGRQSRKPAPPAGWRVRLKPAALFLLGLVLLVAPVTVRNFVVSKDFVLITSNGGLNFYIGNSDRATGGYVKPEGLDIITDPDGEAIAERAVGRDLKPSEVSDYWYALARTHIGAHPGAWVKLLVRKLSFVMSSYELPQLENYYFQKRFSPLLLLPLPGFALVAPLGLLGLGLSFRRRRARLLGLFAGAYLLSIAVFFVVARYRLPAMPALVVLASYAVFELIRRIRERDIIALALPVIVLAALLFVVNANLYDVDREKGFAQPHFRLGIIYAQRGLTDEAAAEYREAIRLDPGYVKSYLNLGAVLSETGRTNEAMDVFRSALRRNPAYASARINLAMVLKGAAEFERALSQIDTVLAAEPQNAMALKERGLILYRAGRGEEAVPWLEEALRWDEGGRERSEVEFYLGLIAGAGSPEIPDAAWDAMGAADTLAQRGKVVEAMARLEDAAGLAPRSGEPLRKLALIKRDLGLLEESAELMAEALTLDPMLSQGHFTAGVFLNELQRHDEAIREYEAEIRTNPDFAPAHLNLALTYYFHAGNPNLAAYHYRRHLALGGEAVPACEAILRDLDAPGSP